MELELPAWLWSILMTEKASPLLHGYLTRFSLLRMERETTNWMIEIDEADIPHRFKQKRREPNCLVILFFVFGPIVVCAFIFVFCMRNATRYATGTHTHEKEM